MFENHGSCAMNPGGFDLAEIASAAGKYRDSDAARLWLRGGFPRSYLAATDEDSMAWRRNAIASHVEVDLLMIKGSRHVEVEFKRAGAPAVARSMRIAMQDLTLDALHVVYPGAHRFPLEAGVEAVPLWAVLREDPAPDGANPAAAVRATLNRAIALAELLPAQHRTPCTVESPP